MRDAFGKIVGRVDSSVHGRHLTGPQAYRKTLTHADTGLSLRAQPQWAIASGPCLFGALERTRGEGGRRAVSGEDRGHRHDPLHTGVGAGVSCGSRLAWFAVGRAGALPEPAYGRLSQRAG